MESKKRDAINRDIDEKVGRGMDRGDAIKLALGNANVSTDLNSKNYFDEDANQINSKNQGGDKKSKERKPWSYFK